MEIETLIRMQGESYTKDKHLERDARFRGRIESCPLWVSCSRPRRNRERRTFVIPSNETIARFFFPLSERKRYNRSIPPLFSQNFSFFFFLGHILSRIYRYSICTISYCLSCVIIRYSIVAITIEIQISPITTRCP